MSYQAKAAFLYGPNGPAAAAAQPLVDTLKVENEKKPQGRRQGREDAASVEVRGQDENPSGKQLLLPEGQPEIIPVVALGLAVVGAENAGGLEDEAERRRREEEERQVLFFRKHRVWRGPREPADKGCYDGVYFRNSFRILGGPLYLYAVGFYGLVGTGGETIRADVEVATPPTWQERWENSCLPWRNREEEIQTFRTNNRIANVPQHNDFEVVLDEPVCIQPNKWWEIRFRIVGRMGVMFHCMKEGNQVREKKIRTELGEREIEWFSGSRQMPYMVFCAENPRDLSNYIMMTTKEMKEFGYDGDGYLDW